MFYAQYLEALNTNFELYCDNVIQNFKTIREYYQPFISYGHLYVVQKKSH
jgi:S-adenosylmethionine synthetase